MQRFTPSRFSSAVVPTLAQGGIALAALAILCPAAAAETLTAWQFDPATQQLTLTLPTGVVPQYNLSATGDRLVLTVPNLQLGNVPTTAIYDGPIQHIQLFPTNNAVEIVLTPAPGVALTRAGQLVSVMAGSETQWVFTPALVQTSQASPSISPPPPGHQGVAPGTTAPGMIVEMPPLPADPNLNWPYTGVGRLSISAANLVQPANLDTFNTLPETLAIDPFSLGLPSVDQQVSVPSLAELDAAVGVALGSPAGGVPTSGAVANVPTTALPDPGATAPANPGVMATSPPGDRPNAGPVATVPALPQPTTAAATRPSSPQATPQVTPPPTPQAIDQDTNGLAIVVSSAAPPTATDPRSAITTPPPSAGGNPVAQVSNNPVPSVSPAVVPTGSPTGSPTLGTNPVQPPFLTVPPPTSPTANPSASTTPSQPPASNNLLAVPTMPNPTTPGVVIPPSLTAEPVPVAAAPDAAIAFGQPLPGYGLNGSDPAWGDRRLAPDTLIAAGSILELRYTGPASLSLDPGTVHQEVLVLETEIRDPVTNGIVAPAGSQLIGQFRASGDGHQWVSQMLIAPDGQRIPFASTSDYVYNSPQINGGGIALGTGLGVLALTLLTGFSGIGLLGGALIGATAAVGTAPQMLVIEPNQVIYAEVMQDIYRAMPIAAMPAETQEWGATPGSWYVP